MKHALAALLTLAALAPAATAAPAPPTPEFSQICATIPSLYVGSRQVTNATEVCLPWI